MSYRVDIPTLSANEVYTLTFEYEGTETIQLIVGDLTLETTNRRVVFTTTSPVNYIKSNVKLQNLNMYEGFYESDDFGGEYIQESYLSGKSLVNLWTGVDSVKNGTWGASSGNFNGNYVTTTENNTLKMVVQQDTFLYLGNMDKSSFYNFLKEGNQYTIIVDIIANTLVDMEASVNMCHSQQIVKGSAGYTLINGETNRYVSVVNAQSYTYSNPPSYWGNITGDYRNQSGNDLEWRVMILEGDYYDEALNGSISSFYGIGCVKSPKIVSIGNEQGFGKGGRL